MRISIKDDETLEYTGKVIMHLTDTGDFPYVKTGRRKTAVRIQYGSRVCGAILEHVHEFSESFLSIDKHLRLLLKVSSRGFVDIEPFEPPEAEHLTITLPDAWHGSQKEEDIRSLLVGKPVTAGQKFELVTLSGIIKEGQITETTPDGIVMVTDYTDVAQGTVTESVTTSDVTLVNIGGLKKEIQRVRELVELPLRFPEQFERLGIDTPRGVILYGPPGTGKTLIARALCNETGAKFVSIAGPEIMSSYFAGSEKALEAKFEEARRNAPAIILIDELDSIAPSRDKTQGETERRIVATLLTLMDGLTALKGVVVIGTTNRLDSIDIALRRAGRFEAVNIGPPDKNGRVEILQIHIGKMKKAGSLAGDIDILALAEITPGFVGADIALLTREAAYCALRRSIPMETLEKEGIDPDQIGDVKVHQQDFLNALTLIQPSAMREVMVQGNLEVTWDQIGGLEEVKRTLIESVVYGIKKPEAFKALGIKPPKGLLLYGPPGTGKTMLAKAVARDCGGHFIPVRGPELRSKWFGESEEKVRFIFAKAREVAPCVIFFDEIDAIAPARGREASGLTDSIVNQMLTELDNLHSADNIFVLGATNLPDIIDPAILRPGRFDRQVYVPLPDKKQREAIFKIYLQKNTRCAPDVKAAELADITEGMSGADISEICYLAGRYALRESDFVTEKTTVNMQSYQAAVADVKQTQKRLKPRIGFKTPGSDASNG